MVGLVVLESVVVRFRLFAAPARAFTGAAGAVYGNDSESKRCTVLNSFSTFRYLACFVDLTRPTQGSSDRPFATI